MVVNENSLAKQMSFAAFVRANDPAFRNKAYYLGLRPTATHAGGETLAIAPPQAANEVTGS